MKLVIAAACISLLLLPACTRETAPDQGERARRSKEMRELIKRQVQRYEGLVEDTVRASQDTKDPSTILVLRQLQVSLTRIQYMTAALDPLEEVYLSCPLDETRARAAMQAEYGKAAAATQAVGKTIKAIGDLVAGDPDVRSVVSPITTTALAVLEQHGGTLDVRYKVLSSSGGF